MKKGCGSCTACSCANSERMIQWDFEAPDGAYFNMMRLDAPALLVPQHSHTEPHTTLLVRGSLRAWRENELLGDFTAPAAIYIEARIKHKFVSLEKNTLAFCVFSKPPVTHEIHGLQEATTCLSGS